MCVKGVDQRWVEGAEVSVKGVDQRWLLELGWSLGWRESPK